MITGIRSNKLIRDNIAFIRAIINESLVSVPSSAPKFVFLCGANKGPNIPSERRKALCEFAQKRLPGVCFFLAEKAFETLIKEGHKGNILDVEHLISEFSDYIIIVLESTSAFAELGAFAHKELRDKLIVINDSKYKDTNSFIRLGPIKAIEEAKGSERVIYYGMSDDGVERRDSIGDVYLPVHNLLKNRRKILKTGALSLELCNPSEKFDKNAAMILHDLIYLTGPVLYKELIEILKLIFGEDKTFNRVQQLLAILVSFQSISRDDKGRYRSSMRETYYHYKCDMTGAISVFRNYILKHHPERFVAS